MEAAGYSIGMITATQDEELSRRLRILDDVDRNIAPHDLEEGCSPPPPHLGLQVRCTQNSPRTR